MTSGCQSGNIPHVSSRRPTGTRRDAGGSNLSPVDMQVERNTTERRILVALRRGPLIPDVLGLVVKRPMPYPLQMLRLAGYIGWNGRAWELTEAGHAELERPA